MIEVSPRNRTKLIYVQIELDLQLGYNYKLYSRSTIILTREAE